MGLLGGMVKAGLAKRVYDEARKPHNQAKIKSMVGKLTGKTPRGGGSTNRPAAPR